MRNVFKKKKGIIFARSPLQLLTVFLLTFLHLSQNFYTYLSISPHPLHLSQKHVMLFLLSFAAASYDVVFPNYPQIFLTGYRKCCEVILCQNRILIKLY